MNKKTKELYYSMWNIAIAICLVLALFAVFLPSCTRRTVTETQTVETTAADATLAESTASDEPVAETEPVIVPTILPETEDAGEEYLSRIVILGDTVAAHYCDAGYLEAGQVWTGQFTETTVQDAAQGTISFYGKSGTSHSIATAVGSETPDIIIIALGSYGLTETDEASFKDAYGQIIADIRNSSPATTVICQSVLPVLESALDDGTTNAMIEQANDWILESAEEYGVHYLNLYDELVDSTGNLYGVYAEEDGRTLTESGCEAVMQLIRTHTL